MRDRFLSVRLYRIDVLGDESLEQAASFPRPQHLAGPVGPRLAEVIVVSAPQTALAAEGRDAALYGDPCAQEGREVLRRADGANGFEDDRI